MYCTHSDWNKLQSAGYCSFEELKNQLSRLQLSRLQLSRLQLSTRQERKRIIGNIICLHLCTNTHRQSVRKNDGLLNDLIQEFELRTYSSKQVEDCLQGFCRPKFVEYAAGSKKSILTELQGPSLKVPSASGYVYIFTTPYKHGYVKIGWKACCDGKRLKEWQECFPDAELVCEAEFDYPEQIEKLIHLQLLEKRRQITCTRAIKKKNHPSIHDEWFEMTVADAKAVLKDWQALVKEEQLYTSDRMLSTKWAEILPTVSDQTASALLQAVKKVKANDAVDSVGEILSSVLSLNDV